jgi:hypothetical protein
LVIDTSSDLVKPPVQVTEMEGPVEVGETGPAVTPTLIMKIHQHLRETDPVYDELMKLKDKVSRYFRKEEVEAL